DRGYEWERKHEIQVAVADLPEGGDPDDLARTDPDRLRAAVAEATPFLGYRIERILAAADTSTPEGRARAAEVALAAVAEHPNEFVRDPYVMEVADRCRLDADRLRSSIRAGVRPRIRTERPAPRRRSVTAASEALRLAIADPAEV